MTRSGRALASSSAGPIGTPVPSVSANTRISGAGYQPRCVHAELMGAIGTQAQYARIPLADGTLVATPATPDEDLIPSLLAASDVLGTGWFAAVAAEAGPGKTVAVVGDGAVGLLGVLAARQLKNCCLPNLSMARQSSSVQGPARWRSLAIHRRG